jgi:hypothetical protein
MKERKLMLGTGGTLGIISCLGACGGACGLAVFPLGSLLGAIGLGGVAVYLPYLRWPLIALSLALSFLVLRGVARRGSRTQLAAVSFILAGALVFAGYQAFKPTPCEALSGTQAGAQGVLFDAEMAKGCELGCSYRGHVDEKKIVAQPGAKVGDLVHCPVSGVVFRVKPGNPEITYNGKRYFTCCATCAARYEQRQRSLGKT